MKLKTLELRRQYLKFGETRRVLEKLSVAAESLGDFSQAIEFEKSKSSYLTTREEAQNSGCTG